MNPFEVSKYVLVSLMIIFVIFLMFISMTRVLKVPIVEHVDDSIKNTLEVDILINQPLINFNATELSKSQKVFLCPGMTILYFCNDQNDGLYVVDDSNQFIRIDCVHNTITYFIHYGDSAQVSFKPCSNSLKQLYIQQEEAKSNETTIHIHEKTAILQIFVRNKISQLNFNGNLIKCLVNVLLFDQESVVVCFENKKYEISTNKRDLLCEFYVSSGEDIKAC